jgi:two-component system, OmpR family, phosphate regulon response regulator PhoB
MDVPHERGPLVLVVDDDDCIRRLMRDTLESAGCRVHDTPCGEQALIEARRSAPTVVVLDVNLPPLSGYEVCRRLKEPAQPPAVLLVSGDRTEWFDTVAGLMIGADDYLAKPFEPAVLVASVRALVRRAAPEDSGRANLSRRELDVLRELVRGGSHKEIAETLAISRKTVGSHIERVFAKLGVHSSGEAVACALREQLVTPRA